MRLFVACDLSNEARARLGAIIDELKREMPRLRWVRPEAIHLTLRFLGEVGDAERGRISRELAGAVPGAASPFEVSLESAGLFPERGRPRVLWIGLAEPTGGLAALHRRVEEAARGAGFPPEQRPFRPHLTLARMGEGRPPEVLDAAVSRLRGVRHGAFSVARVHLFQSELKPGGAAYKALEEYAL